MTKQGEIQALQSLIFEYFPTQNRNFNLSIFVPNVFQMASKDIRNRGPRVPLAQKNGRREVYKTRQKTSIRKVRQYVKNVPKKGTPKSDLFVVFGVWGQRRSRVVPKTLPSTLQGQTFLKIWQKVVGGIGFLWCFTGSCPRLNPHAPKRFREACAFSQRLPEFSSV